MTESEFNQRADHLLHAIGEAVDASDTDCDWDLAEGILTLDTPKGQIIINRHAPSQEIWLASRTGAAHFRWDGQTWQDTRNVNTFHEALSQMFFIHAGQTLSV